jgi:hypothetical protein
MICVTAGPLGGRDDLSRQAAARELIDADERNSTANGHFLKLEAAVDALGGSSPRTQVDHGPATPPTTG